MMNTITPLAICLFAALTLSSCRVVRTPDAADAAVSDDAAGDDARTAALIEKNYGSALLPLILDASATLPDLRKALSGGLDAAGAQYGNRGAGEGAAWNFAVRGQGTVVAAKLDSRARQAELDTDGDGKGDLTLQLGPVIKGTALRDVAPFFRFDDFRDQIAFAKLARALNDRAAAGLTIPEGVLVGSTLDFAGVVALKSVTEPWLVTVVRIGPAR